MSKRGSIINRLIDLEGNLIRGPMERTELMLKMQSSADTIRRDIEVLRSAGSDVRYIHGRGWVAGNVVFCANLPEEFFRRGE